MSFIDGLGVAAWLTYSIDGEHTRAGQPIAEAFAVAADVPEIVAVGVNCCAPADVTTAVTVARYSAESSPEVGPQRGAHRTLLLPGAPRRHRQESLGPSPGSVDSDNRHGG